MRIITYFYNFVNINIIKRL